MQHQSKESFTRSPKDILKTMILQRWDYVNSAFEIYYKQKALGQTPNIAPIKSGLVALYNMIEPGIRHGVRKKDRTELDNLKGDILTVRKDFTQLQTAFNTMTDWLYLKGLLKFDDLNLYDITNTQDEDRAQGL